MKDGWDGWYCAACHKKIAGDTVCSDHWTSKDHLKRVARLLPALGMLPGSFTLNPKHATFAGDGDAEWKRFNKKFYDEAVREYQQAQEDREECSPPTGASSSWDEVGSEAMQTQTHRRPDDEAGAEITELRTQIDAAKLEIAELRDKIEGITMVLEHQQGNQKDRIEALSRQQRNEHDRIEALSQQQGHEHARIEALWREMSDFKTYCFGGQVRRW